MSNELAIAGVTAVLQHILNNIFSPLTSVFGSTVNVSAVAPDLVQSSFSGGTGGATTQNQVNIFLHQVTYNQGWRNEGFPALASTSMEQGRVAVCHAFGLKYKQRVASLLPMGIYTIPEISAAGETEDSCKEKKIGYEVGRARYENNARGHIAGDTAGLLKLVFSPQDKKLLGVSIIGESATELIHIGMMVLDNGLTINEFIEQVFNYPTLSEMYKYAAYDGLGNLAGHKLREG